VRWSSTARLGESAINISSRPHSRPPARFRGQLTFFTSTSFHFPVSTWATCLTKPTLQSRSCYCPWPIIPAFGPTPRKTYELSASLLVVGDQGRRVHSPLVFYYLWAYQGLSKCAYYLTLAMEICKRLGCLGSSVYISCLQMYAWFCMTDNTSLSYEVRLSRPPLTLPPPPSSSPSIHVHHRHTTTPSLIVRTTTPQSYTPHTLFFSTFCSHTTECLSNLRTISHQSVHSCSALGCADV
jgi:hypothetical protein